MDSKTIKIPAFTYDGTGGEVFFFAGEGPQPSSRGFIVPDELGYLAPLGVYDNKDVILQLPGYIKGLFLDIFSSDLPEIERRIQITTLPLKPLFIMDDIYNLICVQLKIWFKGTVLNPTGHPINEGLLKKTSTIHLYLCSRRRVYSYFNSDPFLFTQSEPFLTIILSGTQTVFLIDWLALYDKANEKYIGNT